MIGLKTIFFALFILAGFYAFTQAEEFGVNKDESGDWDLDSDFGQSGVSFLLPDNVEFFVQTATVQLHDGSFVSTGICMQSGATEFSGVLCKTSENGEIDLSFGVAGWAFITIPGSLEPIDMILLEDESMFISGKYRTDSDADIFVVKLKPDATPDMSFGQGGYLLFDYNNLEEHATKIERDNSGNIFVSGGTSDGVTSDALIVSCDSDGNIRTDFANQGFYVYDSGSDSDEVTAMCAVPSGDLFAGIETASGVIFICLNEQGDLKSDFGINGVLDNVFLSDAALTVNQIYQAPVGGFIYVGGSVETIGGIKTAIAKISPAGVPDISYGQGGVAKVDAVMDAKEEPGSFIVQANGKLLLTGVANTVSGYQSYVLKLNAFGDPDEQFCPGGILVVTMENLNVISTEIFAQNSGSLILAGYAWHEAAYSGFLTRYTRVTLAGQNTEEMGVKIFPNPATSVLHVGISGIDEQVSFKVLDASGNVVELVQVAPGEVCNLDVSHLSPGVYFICAPQRDIYKKFQVIW